MNTNPHENAVRRYLELLFEPGDVFEVRVPDCRDRPDSRFPFTCSGYYTQAELARAAHDVLEVERSVHASGIYVTLNPVSAALLARSANRIRTKARETTSDKDIPHRRWLLIDVDPVRPAGVSATDSELQLAQLKAQAIAEYLQSLNWPAPILAMSGNGYHLLYRIDLPGDDDGLVQAVLHTLSERFDDEYVSVDRSVHNPARIVKIVGTLSRKGDDLCNISGIEDRPHRRAKLLDVPESVEVVPVDKLQALVNCNDNNLQAKPEPTFTSADTDLIHTPEGVRTWLEAHGVAVKGVRRNGSKTMLLLEQCPINPEIVSTGQSDIAVLVCDDGKLAYCNQHNRGRGYRWSDLRKALEPGWEPGVDDPGDVDLSGFGTADDPCNDTERKSSEPDDPGPIPEHLFTVPGFITEVMEFSLSNAPYPNVGLAFCGALALQSFLIGRKVRTPGDLRSNIYLLALASSGTGKDFPRKVNSQVLFEVGLINALADKFASGEGIQDALVRTSAMLFQNDEMDGVLRQISLDRENRRESIPNILLTLYTSANDIYPVRVKASQKEPAHIDQPHLTLFGTATPQYFYESLSQRMLTNGFFARMMIIDVGKRGAGQTPGSARYLPETIINTARWWAEFQPGATNRNLQALHPQPRVVELDDEATNHIEQLQRLAEAEYDQAEANGNEVARTAWSRTCENAKKLALIYACSADHENPVITLPAVEWAAAFAMHQTRRQLYLAACYVSTTEFDGLCKKAVRFLKQRRDSSKEYPLPDWRLRRHLALNPKSHNDVTETLVKQQRIQFVTITGKTKPRAGWILL